MLICRALSARPEYMYKSNVEPVTRVRQASNDMSPCTGVTMFALPVTRPTVTRGQHEIVFQNLTVLWLPTQSKTAA